MSEQLPKTTTSSPNLMPAFVAIVLLTFLAGLFSYSNSDNLPSNSHQHSKSYNLLGHHALRSILKKLNFEVYTNRSMTMQPQKNSTVVFIAPSDTEIESFSNLNLKQNIRNILKNDVNVIVACPKWREKIEQQDGKDVTVGKKIEDLTTVREFTQNLHKRLDLLRIDTSEVDFLYKNRNFSIFVSEEMQLFDDDFRYTPIVTSPYGHLVVQVPSKKGKFFLVSDPDIFTNHEIGKQDNGFLLIQMLHKITQSKKLWFDEVGHGLGRDPSIIKILLSFPVICITIQLVFFFAFLVLRLWNPFHQIIPEPKRERSREEQIRSISYLSYTSQKHHFFLNKYFDGIIQQMENRYPTIRNMELEQKLDYLNYIAKNKEIRYNIKTIYQQLKTVQTPQKMKQTLHQIAQWKEKIGHGEY